jgi:hypothetical protein
MLPLGARRGFLISAIGRLLPVEGSTSGCDPKLTHANVRYGNPNSIVPGATAVTAESPYRGLCSRHSMGNVEM